MIRHRGLKSAIYGLISGIIIGLFMFNYQHVNQTQFYKVNKHSSLMINSNDDKIFRAFVRNDENMTDNNSSSSSSSNKDDNDNDNLVIVGVMTAEKYLSTRAKAVWETWGKEVPGKIIFFSSEESKVPDNCRDLPLVALPTVDDSYPPQKKSFLMLKYMWINYGDKFEWFIRADDDVYIRTDRLKKLLRSVDSTKSMYIGQAGRGNSEEIGQLALNYDENFCMGGPGVIMSRETMKKVIPHVKDCLNNLYTAHEDVELGRCVKKYAGIPCTWSYEMQSILYHNSSGDQSFTGNLKKREVHQAITLHPIKSPPYMYRLHNYMRGLKIQDLQHERIKLHRDIYSMAELLGDNIKDFISSPIADNVRLFAKPDTENYFGDTLMLGIPAGLRSFKPQSEDEVIPWDFISRSEYSLGDLNPRRRIHSDVKEGLEDITREVMASINSCSRQRGRVVEERSMLYGYRRVDAYGADTILDLLLVYRKYRGRKVTLPVRRHVYVHQHFTGVEAREVVGDEEVDGGYLESRQRTSNNFYPSFLFNSASKLDPVEDKVINFVVPLAGRFKTFERFINNYEQVCLITNAKTELLVILYPHKLEDSIDSTIYLIDSIKFKYKNAKIKVILDRNNLFSRAKALDQAVKHLNNNDLLFFIDVDIVFTHEALHRVRSNTIINRKIYFPIVFSQYDPNYVNYHSANHNSDKFSENNNYSENIFIINEVTGYWRQFGFGIVSLYKRDYLKIGGFNLSIEGWGKEDVDFYEKSVKSDLIVFRAPDINLIHVYHKVTCDEKLSNIQMSMCKGSRYETLASADTLTKIICNNSDYLNFASNRRNKLKPGN
ncbi:chondroitin sulfate synthase 1 [Microplitis mediator]|uniref:chondroitin sulfate synthase 1 n=1 Tax=Microplitis mediator TaxID=375433 RepID=UPI002556CD00|nr:chondroitin sulfate synthase 1 [Microplitis mediator]